MLKTILNLRKVIVITICLAGSATMLAQDVIMNDSSDIQGEFKEIVTLAPEVEQQLPVLKYTFGNQIDPYGPKKNPYLAGFLSFLIPGAGQFYNGDVGAGFLHLGCNIVFNSIWISSLNIEKYYGNTHIKVDEGKFIIGFLGALTVNVVSVIHASNGAEKVNTARGYRLGDNTYLKVQPAIIPQNNLLTGIDYAYGMNLCLSF